MSDTRTDWLGQEYGVGDLVLYAAMSGRSCTTALARVVRFGPKSVTVAKLKDARGFRTGGRTRYVDKRTGKGIDPWHNMKGIARSSGRENPETGEFVSHDDMDRLGYREWSERYRDWKYAPAKLHEWVETQTPESQVTLTVTENITKWTGETP